MLLLVRRECDAFSAVLDRWSAVVLGINMRWYVVLLNVQDCSESWDSLHHRAILEGKDACKAITPCPLSRMERDRIDDAGGGRARLPGTEQYRLPFKMPLLL